MTLNCTTDLIVATIELLDGDGEVVAKLNDTGQHLIYTIDEITEAYRNQRFICRSSSPFGNQTDSITLSVQTATTNLSPAVAGVTVAILLVLLLITTGFAVAVIIVKRYV